MRAPVHPSDVTLAATSTAEALRPAIDRDWEISAGDLTWSCRRTLDHILDALAHYCAHLASRAETRLPFTRDGAPGATVEQLLVAMPAQAAVLARVAEASPLEARGFHSAGMADAEGFLAMGCDEVLVHGWDVASGLGVPFAPPEDVCTRVGDRLFPWRPTNVEPWKSLLWCNGRIALDDRARQGGDWWWQCAPLDEWDGTRRTRTVPPAWS